MRRLELLIDAARRKSLNKEYSTTIGISQEEFVDNANEAQRMLYREIVKTHPRFFQRDVLLDVVANQEAYDLTSYIHLGRVDQVWFSPSGQTQDFLQLDSVSGAERYSGPGGRPRGYLRRNREVLLVPPSSSNVSDGLRVTLARKLQRLEVRKARVNAVTTGSGAISSLTLDQIATLDPSGEIAKYNHISIVDREGQQKMKGIEYDTIDTSTGVVTLTGGTFTYEEGEAIAAGDYVVLGKDSVNQSSLGEEVEDYLINYMIYCALGRDASESATLFKNTADQILESLVSSFADNDGDVVRVPMINYEGLVEDLL